MRNKIANKQRLLHILDAIGEIEQFVKELDELSFINNSLVKSAVIFQLSIIGEAVNHLTEELKEHMLVLTGKP